MSDQTQPGEENRWRIDKHIPLALVYLLIAQFLGATWMAAQVLGKIDSQEKRISVIENQRVSERLVTLESQMGDTKSLVQRVDANLQRLIERGGPK